jgi:hypothetical protein
MPRNKKPVIRKCLRCGLVLPKGRPKYHEDCAKVVARAREKRRWSYETTLAIRSRSGDYKALQEDLASQDDRLSDPNAPTETEVQAKAAAVKAHFSTSAALDQFFRYARG